MPGRGRGDCVEPRRETAGIGARHPSVLPEIVDVLRGRADVLIDGGVRRAGDAAKALALGAKAVLIGRAYLYALSADGEAGIARMLEAFRPTSGAR